MDAPAVDVAGDGALPFDLDPSDPGLERLPLQPADGSRQQVADGSPPQIADATAAFGPLPPGQRCDGNIRRLVDPGAYPVPSGRFNVRAGPLVVHGPDLFFVLAVTVHSAAQQLQPGAVMRMSLPGGPPAEIASGYVFDGPLFTATEVLLLGTSLDLRPSGIFAVPLGGGAQRALVKVASSAPLGPMATDGTRLYFVGDTDIEQVALHGAAAPAPVATVPRSMLNDIEVVGSQLVLTFTDGTVRTLSVPAGRRAPLNIVARVSDQPYRLVPCGVDICWVTNSESVLQRMPLTGTPTTVIDFKETASILDVAFDGVSFYVLVIRFDLPPIAPRAFAEAILRVSPATGAKVSVIQVANGDALKIAADDACLYWSTSAGIFAVTKTTVGRTYP